MDFKVKWEIDAEGETPQDAARRVWEDVFGRSVAGPDDACIFQVENPETGETLTIDLPEYETEEERT